VRLGVLARNRPLTVTYPTLTSSPVLVAASVVISKGPLVFALECPAARGVTAAKVAKPDTWRVVSHSRSLEIG